jgi:hypothetical protein
MVPETGVEADHNWPQRMTMTTTNVEILRQGWLDAASALAPGLETLPEFLENGLDAAVVDERLDEQSLLRVVTDVTSAAADSLPAEELYFLTRRLQRAVYEYLLSLDALPEPPQRRDGSNGHSTADTTLIGAEEVAALSRNGVVKVKGDPAHGLETIARPVQEPEHAEPEHAEPEHAEAEHAEAEHASVSDTVEAGLAELDAQLSPDEDEPTATAEPEAAAAIEVATEPEAAVEPAPEHSTRPAFTLFRRTGAKTPQPAVESNGHAQTEASEAEATPDSETAPKSNGSTPVAAAETASNGAETPAAEGEEAFVAPRDGFHLSDLADFAVVQRAAATPDASAPVEVEPVEEPEPEAVIEVADEPAPVAEAAPVQAGAAPAPATTDAPNGAAARGWRLRDDDADQTQDANADRSAEDDRFETDPEVVEARLEINDRLRRRRCDEAAALLQRLANDVGGRALAELALDAGDRCRALGKGNAALSCYLAASRADPVHETPLLRLADICIDDHDIDLAVSYLERVTRLRRLRNDDKGALKLYRKIVTIAPYRDDILAMLMRAQANGRFDE